MGRISGRNYVIHRGENAFRFWDFGIFLGLAVPKIRRFPLENRSNLIVLKTDQKYVKIDQLLIIVNATFDYQ
jgi:hypothetical protein